MIKLKICDNNIKNTEAEKQKSDEIIVSNLQTLFTEYTSIGQLRAFVNLKENEIK